MQLLLVIPWTSSWMWLVQDLLLPSDVAARDAQASFAPSVPALEVHHPPPWITSRNLLRSGPTPARE